MTNPLLDEAQMKPDNSEGIIIDIPPIILSKQQFNMLDEDNIKEAIRITAHGAALDTVRSLADLNIEAREATLASVNKSSLGIYDHNSSAGVFMDAGTPEGSVTQVKAANRTPPKAKPQVIPMDETAKADWSQLMTEQGVKANG